MSDGETIDEKRQREGGTVRERKDEKGRREGGRCRGDKHIDHNYGNRTLHRTSGFK